VVVVMVVPLPAQEIIGLIPVPNPNFERIILKSDSFGSWLRSLPLKPANSAVLDYRGRVHKAGEDTAVGAVVDMDISGRKMEQCMDILIRLYAEFVWDQSRVSQLRLPLPGGYWLTWQDWANGFRPKYQGIHVSMVQKNDEDFSLNNYRAFLREIYATSHTQQFYHAYQLLDRQSAQPGDFIVKKGRKRHAVMIVDIAQNMHGEQVALIGHGDTPACQFYLLRLSKNSLWFPLKNKEEVLPLPIRRKMTWDGLRRFDLPKKK
jgi:hypothetical protein